MHDKQTNGYQSRVKCVPKNQKRLISGLVHSITAKTSRGLPGHRHKRRHSYDWKGTRTHPPSTRCHTITKGGHTLVAASARVLSL
ncbi:hypothetical protein Sjap_003092 [Stephania japonica]|uniref:Uncharacterized protein n=1 Tax=Stephania japonica TaxID=461633 RepID=A0AAP0KQ87_9MAGN